VEVSNNGQDFTSNNIQYTYYSSLLNVTSIVPELGPNEGGTKVAVYGKGFVHTARLQTENIKCKFGTLNVTGTYNTTTGYVQCISPSAFMVKNWVAVGANDPADRTGFSGIVPLEISFDRGQHYTSSNASFIYNAAPIQVVSLKPNFGPRTGGTSVTMIGHNFNHDLMNQLGYMRVKMGGEYVTITKIDSDQGVQVTTKNAQSIAPVFTDTRVYPMEVPMEISLNNQQFTNDDVRFIFFDLPAVTYVLPTRGSALGGTVVSIHGTNFLNLGTSACRFGTDKPQQVAEFVPTGKINISNSSGAGRTNTSRVYQTGYYVCTTPPSIQPLAKNPPPVIVDVSLNSESYQFTNALKFPDPYVYGANTNIFTYYRVPVVISSLLPSTGPVMGGTTVTVTGLNFTRSTEIRCRFGYYRSGWYSSPRIVAGTYYSEKEIRCVSPHGNTSYNWPAQKFDNLPTVATTFDLALNGQQYTTSQTPFLYAHAVDTFYVTSITPGFAPGEAAYRTHMNVTGYNFQNTGEISCKFLALFNPAQPAFIKETKAEFFTSTSVTCWTPYFSALEWASLQFAKIAVDISLNTQNYRSDQDPNFLYRTVVFYPPNPPVNVTPASGPLSGGTNVIIGLNAQHTDEFLLHPKCRWSYQDDAVPFDVNSAKFGVRQFVTQAEAKKSTAVVTCPTPTNAADVAVLQAAKMPLKVALHVSYNGQNYEAVPVNFTFYSASEVKSISPTSGLTAADYKVTITGNNFLGGSQYTVKYGSALASTIQVASPTKLVVSPPAKQAVGDVHVYVSLNNQDWIDSCYKTFGATSDHVVLHGTCNQWTWAADPICYTCQTPLKPASVESGGLRAAAPWAWMWATAAALAAGWATVLVDNGG